MLKTKTNKLIVSIEKGNECTFYVINSLLSKERLYNLLTKMYNENYVFVHDYYECDFYNKVFKACNILVHTKNFVVVKMFS